VNDPVVLIHGRGCNWHHWCRGDRRHRHAAAAGGIPTPPPRAAFPRARKVLEIHAEAVAERLSGISDKAWPPISDEFVVALRAESSGLEAAVDAALPLLTVAANLGEIELMYPSSAGAVTPRL
jgi:hypothetical protein